MIFLVHSGHNFLKIFYLFIFREREREGERERNINRLPLEHTQNGIESTTQACVPTGNRTSDILICGMMPNPLSHTGQGKTGQDFVSLLALSSIKSFRAMALKIRKK